jgi:hypothetical protein
MSPTTCATAYFDGIPMHIWTWYDMGCPSTLFDSRPMPGQLMEDFSEMLAERPEDALC